MTERLAHETSVQPVACTLRSHQARDQLTRWDQLREAVRHVAIDGRGATLWFEPTVAEAVRAVVEREAQCCAFLSLDRSEDRSLVRLDIESDSEEGIAVAHLLASHASGGSQ